MASEIGGSLKVIQSCGYATYKVVANDITPITSSYDIVNILNPSTSTVLLVPTRLYIAMDATAASTMDAYMVRRTAANTGGTPVAITYNAATSALTGTITFIPHDTNDAASQATINAYSVNPTYGTGLQVEMGHLTVPAAATPSVGLVPWEINWTTRGGKPLIIRPGQSFAPSFGGQTPPAGANMYMSVEWIEVPLSGGW